MTYFNERHFFDRLITNENSGIFTNTKKIPFHFNTFNLKDDENNTANRISLLTKGSIGHLPLESETRVHIQELVSNAFHHSQATIDVGCISKFNVNSGTFEFYIADQGRGIKNSFSRNKTIWSEYSKYNDAEILDKATEQYVTCNPHTAPQYEHGNSGIGLYYLREFCAFQNGHLVIISGKGYYYVDKNRLKKKVLPIPWPGTLVAFKANLKDVSREYLSLKGKFVEDFDKSFSFTKTK